MSKNCKIYELTSFQQNLIFLYLIIQWLTQKLETFIRYEI